MQEIAQIKAKRWHKGRVVLVGDAAYCPSPMSGHGTSTAVTGAYVLACELAKQPKLGKNEVTKAFETFERVCRPYGEKVQDVSLAFLRLGWPESRLPLTALWKLVGVFSAGMNYPMGDKLFNKVFSATGADSDERIVLPKCHFYCTSSRHDRYMHDVRRAEGMLLRKTFLACRKRLHCIKRICVY